ncbi:hypothetical protein ACJRO7_003245 [Eucalyptus globulus]|uniref:DYW domain-containing protein n=1 Tax=Eucalyptus globulus TaxID=34317 RepID=A0ABD3IWD4_EUCGL
MAASACHARVICLGLDMVVNAYSKCGVTSLARKVFEEMLHRTWFLGMTIFSSCTRVGEFAVSSVLCACVATRVVLTKSAMGSNVFVKMTLVDVYVKCGLIGDANLVFEFLRKRGAVSRMVGYVQHDIYEEALLLFYRAHVVGLKYDQFMVSSAISACADLATLIEGKQVRALTCNSGAALMNAMISSFAKYTRPLKAMILYEKMQRMGIYPSEVTYVSMLSACSHMGLVENGRRYFALMIRDHNLSPNAGLVDEAYDMIIPMPFDATPSIWELLLASCRISGNLGNVEVTVKKLFELEPHIAGNHILLSNTYSANKMWDGVKKEKGKSWIHSFVAGDRFHPEIVNVYLKFDDLSKEVVKGGYRAKTENDIHDLEEIKNQKLLRYRSEKLAFVFALLCLPQSAPIKFMRNLRICADCHLFMTIVSGITSRVIIVRDANRFHHFLDECCSCANFWTKC